MPNLSAARKEPAATADPPDGRSRYCGFVQPEHPLVAELFAGPEPPAPGAAVERALDLLRQRCVYRSRPGRRSFDEIAAERPSAGHELELNCVDLTTLLVSHLRNSGFGEELVWVALAGVRGFCQHHAWTLVRLPDSTTAGPLFAWIDPARLVAATMPGGQILDRHDLYVIFNDWRLLFSAGEKRRLLLEGR